MDCIKKAEEFFKIMIDLGASLENIPQDCMKGETGTLLYLNSLKKPITPSELSEVLNVSLPRVLSLLKSLESKGLIEKNIDTIDKRKTIVSITEKGNQLIKEKKEESIKNISKIFEKLDDKEVYEYIRLTKKIGQLIIDEKNNIIIKGGKIC